jgi:hypothetical protein
VKDGSKEDSLVRNGGTLPLSDVGPEKEGCGGCDGLGVEERTVVGCGGGGVDRRWVKKSGGDGRNSVCLTRRKSERYFFLYCSSFKVDLPV